MMAQVAAQELAEWRAKPEVHAVTTQEAVDGDFAAWGDQELDQNDRKAYEQREKAVPFVGEIAMGSY